MQIFRERFNQLYIDSGKTIKDFASDMVGTSRQSVGYYLNGDRVPDSETLSHICKNCNVSADWLLGLSDVRTPEKNFKTACATFGLSEAAGKTLIEKQGNELNSFLELPIPFWNEFLAYIGLFNSFKSQMQNDTQTRIEFREDHIVMNVHGAIRYLANRLGKEIESTLYEKARKEALERGKS